jgi:hypothetical protein
MCKRTVLEKIKTHFYLITFPENCVICEIMLKNIVEPNMTKMTIAYGIRAWHAVYLRLQIHSVYVTLIAFHGNNGYANVSQE